MIADVSGQWVHIGGPDAATTGNQFSAFVTNGKYIFAGINRNGIFRSSDKGVSWSSVTNNISSISITAIAAIDTMVFVATTEVLGFIFRSTDNGSSWQTVSGGNIPDRRIIYSLAAIGTDLFAGTDTGLFVSSDLGKSWAPSGLSGISVHSLYAEKTNLYAGTQPEGIYVSSDTGKKWSQSNGKFSTVSYSGIAVEGIVAGNGILYAGAYSGIYESTDIGKNWQLAYSTEGVRSLAFSKNAIFASRTFYDNGLFGEILRSTDKGMTWNPINPDANRPVIAALDVIDETIYIVTSFGVYYSTDLGDSWIPVLPRNVRIDFLKDIGSGFLAGVSGSVWRAIDSSAGKWQFMQTWPGMNLLLSEGGKLIAENGRSISISTDTGRSWTVRSDDLYYGITSFAVSDTIVIAGSNCGGVYRLNLKTWKWENITFGIHYLFGKAVAIIDTLLVVNMENCDSIGYVSTTHKPLSQTYWVAGFLPYATYIQTFLVKGSNLFAGSSGGIFQSSDFGVSWREISGGLFREYVTALTFADSTWYAGTIDGRIFLSSNNGTAWRDISKALGKGRVNSIAVYNNYLLAGTDSGVWRRPMSEFQNSSTVYASITRKDDLLSYPNPFSQSTSIKFSSSDHSYSQVSIHNLLGSEVARLFTGSLDAGEHSFTWDANGMPAGMYVCVVRKDGRTEELPIMLVK